MTHVDSSASQPVGTRDELERLRRQIDELKTRVEQHERDIQMHVTRMGQLQADIDLIRAAWSRIGSQR